MKTKNVLKLVFGIVALAAVFEGLSRHFHSDLFLYIYFGLQLLVGGFIFYAIFRENNLGDKSENVSNKGALMIFSGVGLMLALIIIHTLRH